jgi:hypothetical protein
MSPGEGVLRGGSQLIWNQQVIGSNPIAGSAHKNLVSSGLPQCGRS